jgi:hypothetical protein
MLAGLVLVCAVLLGGLTAADEGVPPKSGEYRPEEWTEQVGEVRERLRLLEMFAQATQFGGMKVRVPKEIQKVPLELIPGTEGLRDKDIELYVKELDLRSLAFEPAPEPLWLENHPALPVLLRFATLGLSIEAKTKLGTIPLGATFRDGVLPFDFDLNQNGYDLSILPERRTADAKLDNLKLQVGGPLTSGIANTFFKGEVAKLVMKYGMGQTLKMSEGGLFGGAPPTSLLGVKKGSAEEQAVNTVIDALRSRNGK